MKSVVACRTYSTSGTSYRVTPRSERSATRSACMPVRGPGTSRSPDASRPRQYRQGPAAPPVPRVLRVQLDGAPHLPGDVDHQPKLCRLLLDGDVVAMHRRG